MRRDIWPLLFKLFTKTRVNKKYIIPRRSCSFVRSSCCNYSAAATAPPPPPVSSSDRESDDPISSNYLISIRSDVKWNSIRTRSKSVNHERESPVKINYLSSGRTRLPQKRLSFEIIKNRAAGARLSLAALLSVIMAFYGRERRKKARVKKV